MVPRQLGAWGWMCAREVAGMGVSAWYSSTVDWKDWNSSRWLAGWRSKWLPCPYANSSLSFYIHSVPYSSCLLQTPILFMTHHTAPAVSEVLLPSVFHEKLPCAALACKMNEAGAQLQHLPKIICDNLIKLYCNYTSEETELRLGRQAQFCHFLSLWVFAIW